MNSDHSFGPPSSGLLLAILGLFLALTEAHLSQGEPHCGFAKSAADLPRLLQIRPAAANTWWCNPVSPH